MGADSWQNMGKVFFQETLFDLIVIASSAGGLDALTCLLKEIPGSFPAALLIVQHLQPGRKSLFPQLLSKRTSLGVLQAEDGMELKPGVAYISPPGVHLLVQSDQPMVLSNAAPVDFHRPNADLLFESAAGCCGNRTIAVVLSGMGNDGSRGIKAIHAVGGKVIAQSPGTSKHGGMPQSAILTGIVDYILPISQIAPKIIALVNGEEQP